jgi:enterochelin esterase-like enzyme
VTPFGHTVEPGTHGWPFVEEQGDFSQDFMEVLLPFLITQYRISGNSKDWALAGFSMGGYHTLKIGLSHLDQFGNLGPFSWGNGRKFFDEHAPHVLNNPGQINKQIQTFYIACGRDDFLFKGAEEMDFVLTELGIEHLLFVSEGGHDMANWRRYLYQYAQLLFQD